MWLRLSRERFDTFSQMACFKDCNFGLYRRFKQKKKFKNNLFSVWLNTLVEYFFKSMKISIRFWVQKNVIGKLFWLQDFTQKTHRINTCSDAHVLPFWVILSFHVPSSYLRRCSHLSASLIKANPVNPFYATGFISIPLENIGNLWFSDIFRGHHWHETGLGSFYIPNAQITV